jgi:hypothetical protein
MNILILNSHAEANRHRDMRHIHFEMPSWWGGRLKSLRGIPQKDIVDAAIVSLFLLAMSALVGVPIMAIL